MKKAVFLVICLALLFTVRSMAQETEKDFGIKISGYVKNDFFFDTRQTVAAREGHFLLWPSAQNLDANGLDINAKPSFNFLAIQSRLSLAITGPDAFGAKTSGLIEGDFFAQLDANINLFRLRHALVKLKWTHTELLTGQYWNPLFVTGCFPGTVSFNTGAPLQSFARNPQIRLTQDIGRIQIIAAALAQRDYTSRGPSPTDNATTAVSAEYLRNSLIPDLHFQVHYSAKNEENGTAILVGTGVAYKSIVPRLYSTVGNDKFAVNERVGGITALAFTKLTLKPVTIKLEGRYGENIADVLSISGFAIKNVENPLTGLCSYTPLKNASFWGEVHSNGKKLQVGVFGGYMKNLGTKEAMSSSTNTVYGLATNIESLIRVSPRIIFYSGKTQLACELEYTSAAYGSEYDVNYRPAATTRVANIRALLSVLYSF
ncbi:MAG: hypothetical protein ACOYXB_04205 [Bacteroidota bacterium]